MWGGRFAGGPAAVMERINASIGFDRRLYAQDIAGSKAHCTMLVHQGIIAQEDGAAILAGLDAILAEIEAGGFDFKTSAGRHPHERRGAAAELIGEPAGRLHTARSRNDQVATDFRLWVRDALDGLDAALRDLQAALIDQAEAPCRDRHAGLHPSAGGPAGHLRPPPAGLCRDGWGATAGGFRTAAVASTNARWARRRWPARLPIDRERRRPALGFDRPMANSLDAVSDRDFALEYLAAGGDRGDAPLAPRRGDRAVVLAAVRLRRAVGRLHHRQLDHAAEAQPRRRRAGPRQERPRDRRADRRCWSS
jgi:argininosuccinate lyase